MQKRVSRYVTMALILITVIACDNDKVGLPTVNPVDSLVIVDFYNSMGGEKWPGEYSMWDLRDPATWHGIQLELAENGLKVVKGIHLDFKLEASGCYIPESIGRLKYLSSFEIENFSCLSGKLPESLFDCPLESLIIKNVECLVGPLSPKIEKLKETLCFLEIENCPNFGGVIPPELGACRKDCVSLSGCGFYGYLPFEVTYLLRSGFNNNHLTSIDWRFFTDSEAYLPPMKNNDFSGNVPDEVLSSRKWKSFAHIVFLPFNEGYGFCNVTLKPLD